MEDKVIVDVTVKGAAEAEDDLKAINALTSQLVKNSEELENANKELEKQGKLNSSTYKENQQQIETNSKAISKNSAESRVLQENLTKQSKAAKEASLSTEQMTGALDKAVPGLGSMIQGIMGATKASLAFIATPIGAALAGIVATLALVSMWFTKTEEGGDLIAKTFSQISAAVNVVVDTLVRLVDGFVKIMQGDIIGGIQGITGALTGMGDEMAREVKLAGDLADALDQLEEAELKHGVAVSASSVKIRELMLESKNRLLTEQEKIDKLKEAHKLEVENHAESKRIQDEKLRIAVEEFSKNALYAESRRKQGETDIEYANRIIGLENERKDLRDEVGKQIIASNQIEGESIGLKERLNNMIDMHIEKMKAEDEKKSEQRIKDAEAAKLEEEETVLRREREKAALDQELQEYVDRNTAKALSDQEYNDIVIAEGEALAAKEKAQADKEYVDYQANEMKKLKLKKEVEAAKVQLTQQAFNAIGGLMDQQSKEFKAFSIIQTLYNTYLAAQAAFASQLIPLDPTSLGRAIAAAAFATLAGLGRVAQIASFKEGGDVKAFTIGGKDHSQGGTKFYGEDGTVFEAQRGEGMFILKREAHQSLLRDLSERNVEYGGRSWFSKGSSHLAFGGSAIPVSTGGQQINLSQLADIVIDAVSSLPPPVVTVEDINAGQERVSVAESNALL
jgi:hypothetical protein